MRRKTVVMGTRGSALALAQTDLVLALLQEQHPNVHFTVQKIKTQGDTIETAAKLRQAGKGLFVKELERALIKGKIDLAVHSLKDLPTTQPTELSLAAILQRDDPRDMLIARTPAPLEKWQHGSTLGTSSLRRQAQLRNRYPHLNIVDLKGNVPTRIEKLRAFRSKLEGIVLAAAGLRRLYAISLEVIKPVTTPNVLEGLALTPFSTDEMVPAPGQGALAIETRDEDKKTQALVSFLNDPATAVAVAAERAFLARLEGGCNVPLGVFAEAASNNDGLLTLHAVLSDPEGTKLFRASATGTMESPEELARAVETLLRNQGAEAVLEALRR